jgi:hypothetical protein
MPLRKIQNMVAARHDGRYFDSHPKDPLIGIQMQSGDKAAPDHTDFHFSHVSVFQGG